MSVKAFIKAHAILAELREMGQPLASFRLYVDGSGTLTLDKTPSVDVQDFAECYLRSKRWGWDSDGYATLTTYGGLLDD